MDEISAIDYYLKRLKRDHFKSFLKYVRKQKKLVEKLQRINETAQVMYVQNLMRRYIHKWRDNVLIPAQILNQEVQTHYDAHLCTKTFTAIKEQFSRVTKLNLTVETRLKQRKRVQIYAIVNRWRVDAAHRLFERRLSSFRLRIQSSQLHIVFKCLVDKYLILSQTNNQINENHLLTQYKNTLTLLQQSTKQQQLEKQALACYNQNLSSSLINDLMQKLLQIVRQQDEQNINNQLELMKIELLNKLKNDRINKLNSVYKIQTEVRNEQITTLNNNTNIQNRTRPKDLNRSTGLTQVQSQRNIQLTDLRVAPRQGVQTMNTAQTVIVEKQSENEMMLVKAYIQRFNELKQVINLKQTQVKALQKQIDEYMVTSNNKYTVEIYKDYDIQNRDEIIEELDTLTQEFEQVKNILRKYQEKL
ncbi:Hypothetical_protein [Hexamita inflata]|uniref:Hypothetical_protein n=1 Tax=Hexamita inflata TaxID=28002 RepID=A0AA86R4T0_9EUKA|nr:Hypothetical protein HINF_LOCUS49915 [Hexamita inflata]